MDVQEQPIARDSCSQLDCTLLDHNVVQDTGGKNTEHIKESMLLEPNLKELKSIPQKKYFKKRKSKGWSKAKKSSREARKSKKTLQAMEGQEKPIARDSCSQLDCTPSDRNVVQDTGGKDTELIKESMLLEPNLNVLKSNLHKKYFKKRKSNGWSRAKSSREARKSKKNLQATEGQEKNIAKDSCSQLDCTPSDHNVVQDTGGEDTKHIIKQSTFSEPNLNETAMNDTCFDMFDMDQPESYEIVTDEHVIALIEAVSHYPEIYNPKDPYHKNQDILYRVWKEVGRDLYCVNVRVSGLYCKLKWRAIKTAYVAYFRRKSQNPSSKTKYKYADYLYWLDPYIDPLKPRGPKKSEGLKNRDPKKVSMVVAAKPSKATKSSNAVKSTNTGASTSPTNVVTAVELVEEKIDVEDTTIGGNDTEASPRSNSNNIIEQNGERQIEQAPRNEVVDNVDILVPKTEKVEDSCEVPQRSQEHSAGPNAEESSDMLFLKSILPDLQRMSGRQKNVFKQKTMQLIGEILYPTS